MTKYSDKNFNLLGVNLDSDIKNARKLSLERNVTWRSWQDEGGQAPISSDWQVTGLPKSFLIDASGKIRFRNLRDADLERAIELLLGE